MTAKEAIDILWQYDVNFEPHPAEEVMHAIDMAIKALELVTINAESNEIKVTNCNDNDLIRRQDAVDIVRNRVKKYTTPCVLAVTDIQQLPSAQPKTGKWIDENENPLGWHKVDKSCPVGWCKCSECGEWLIASDEYLVKGNFCPNCGADMRGEQDG